MLLQVFNVLCKIASLVNCIFKTFLILSLGSLYFCHKMIRVPYISWLIKVLCQMHILWLLLQCLCFALFILWMLSSSSFLWQLLSASCLRNLYLLPSVELTLCELPGNRMLRYLVKHYFWMSVMVFLEVLLIELVD
jgi:hypothetical protein